MLYMNHDYACNFPLHNHDHADDMYTVIVMIPMTCVCTCTYRERDSDKHGKAVCTYAHTYHRCAVCATATAEMICLHMTCLHESATKYK